MTDFSGSNARVDGRVFSRVLVGVDGSAEALEAARQAAMVEDVDGELTLLSAWHLPPPVVVSPVAGAETYPLDAEVPRSQAEQAVKEGQAHIAAVATGRGKVAGGFAWQMLLDEAERQRATLIAVGSHGQGRVHGIVAGSTTTEVVDKAPCSVLVARKASAAFPHKIVVGVDGSPQSAAAYAAAHYLAERFGAKLTAVVARGGKAVDKRLIALIVDYHHEDLPDEPVRALVAAAADADLLVVGSRGLHGLKALGSVSERVAHQAHCSTLIVRKAPWQGDGAERMSCRGERREHDG